MEPHHVHSHAKEKHFKHYLFEFFMLFLAVTLGFFVENERDHYVERKREKEYIHSVAEDINQDIHQLDSVINQRKIKNAMMDSLLYLLNYSNIKDHGNDIYYYARWVPRTYRFYSNDRTVQQLNSGNWRLIRNHKVSNALLSYNHTAQSISAYIESREESLVLLMYSSLCKLFDNRVFENMLSGLSFNRPTDNPQLMVTDRSSINEFCNRIHFAKNANYFFITVATGFITNAKNTLNILNQEYGLQN